MTTYIIVCHGSQGPCHFLEYKWECACATFNRCVNAEGCSGPHSLWAEAAYSDMAHKLDPRKIPELISR